MAKVRTRSRSSVSRNGMATSRRVKTAALRRDEIVDAAASIIAEEGIQNLSLSEIEKRTGMSRGQLTYYFPEKEQILLAVFDRTVDRMKQRVVSRGKSIHRDPIEHMRDVMQMIVLKPMIREFVGLQYTFLAQTSHRKDYRLRLAGLYEFWRTALVEELRAALAPPSRISLKTRVSLFQAVAHGLAVQLVADPNAFDRKEMMQLSESLIKLVCGDHRQLRVSKTNTRDRHHG